MASTCLSGRITKYGIALLVITLLGLALRLYHLGTQSFWVDEAFSVVIARHSLPQIVDQVIQFDTHPPLYYFILHFWIGLFGTSEFAVRLLSLIFGILAIPMIYVFGRRLFTRDVGLICAFILAISEFNIQYSQEARMYTMFFLLALLSMYFFIRLLQEGTLAVSAGYVVSTALMLYSHNFSLFVLVVQNLLFAGLLVASPRNRSQIKRWLPIQAIILAIFAPWISVLPRQLHSAQVVVFQNVDPITLVLNHAAGIYGLYLAQIALLLLMLGLAALSPFVRRQTAQNAVMGFTWDRRANLELICFLFVWFLGVIGLPFVLAPFVEHALILPRYMIVATAPLFILVAKGVHTINSRYVKVAILVVIVILSTTNLQVYYATTRNSPAIKDAVAFVNQNARKGDLVIFFPNDKLYSYYTFRPDLKAKGFIAENIDLVGMNATQNRNTLAAAVNGHARVWVVAPEAPNDLRAPVLDYLHQSYNPVNTGDGSDNLHVRLYVEKT